jgi:hypothetical protein
VASDARLHLQITMTTETPPEERRRAYLISDLERADILDIVQAWENDRVRTTRSTSAERAAARQVAWRIRDALRLPGTRA